MDWWESNDKHLKCTFRCLYYSPVLTANTLGCDLLNKIACCWTTKQLRWGKFFATFKRTIRRWRSNTRQKGRMLADCDVLRHDATGFTYAMRGAEVEERGWRYGIYWNTRMCFQQNKATKSLRFTCPALSISPIISQPALQVCASFQSYCCWWLFLPMTMTKSAAVASSYHVSWASEREWDLVLLLAIRRGDSSAALPLPLPTPDRAGCVWQPWLAEALCCCCCSDRGSIRCSRSRNAKSWGPFCWGECERQPSARFECEPSCPAPANSQRSEWQSCL